MLTVRKVGLARSRVSGLVSLFHRLANGRGPRHDRFRFWPVPSEEDAVLEFEAREFARRYEVLAELNAAPGRRAD